MIVCVVKDGAIVLAAYESKETMEANAAAAGLEAGTFTVQTMTEEEYREAISG